MANNIGKFGSLLKPSQAEHYTFTLFSRVENALDSFLPAPVVFKGRLANEKEKNKFVVVNGILSENRGLYVVSTRLPSEVQINDRIMLNNNYYLVEAVGYYAQSENLLNESKFSPEFLTARYTKGIKLI